MFFIEVVYHIIIIILSVLSVSTCDDYRCKLAVEKDLTLLYTCISKCVTVLINVHRPL